jgi:Na+/pantothenate symporter
MLKSPDYLTFAFILLVPVLIGIYHGGGKELFHKISKKLKSKSKKNPDLIELSTQSTNSLKSDKINEKQAKKVEEYIHANSNMHAIPIAFSLVASFISTTTILGTPAEAYQFGAQNFVGALGLCLTPIFGAFVTGPFYAKLKIITIFQYIEMRFNSIGVRLMVTSMSILLGLLNTSIYIFGPATSLSVFTNLNTNESIAIIGIIATFYTAIGKTNCFIQI